MAEVYYPIHLVVGTLVCGTRAIETHDWSELLMGTEKRGGPREVPQKHVAEPRDLFRSPLRAAVGFRLYGNWDDDGDPVPGTMWDWAEHLYTVLLSEFRTVTRKGTQQSLKLVTPWHEYDYGDCFVTNGGKPIFLNPYTVEIGVGFNVPDGEIDLAIPDD